MPSNSNSNRKSKKQVVLEPEVIPKKKHKSKTVKADNGIDPIPKKKHRSKISKSLESSESEASPDPVSKHRTEPPIPTPETPSRVKQIKTALQENYLQQKKLMAELDAEMKAAKPDVHLTIDIPVTSTLVVNSFNKPMPVPEPLRNLLNIEATELPQHKVTSLLYAYFVKHKLIDQPKRQLCPDKKIRKIFGMKPDDIMDFYNLQSWLRKLYVIE